MSRPLKLCAIIESGELELIRELDEGSFQKLLGANVDLEKYRNYRRSRAIFMTSVENFTNRLTAIVTNFIEPQNLPSRPVQEHLLRAVVAEFYFVLSGFLQYVNYTESWVKRYSPKQFDELKRLTGECYDNHFSYRFFYKLRNYAVHRGIPIEFIRDMPLENGKRHLLLALGVQTLLDDYDSWGAVVKKDLKAREAYGMIPNPKTYFDFGEVMRELMPKIDNLVAVEVEWAARHMADLAPGRDFDRDVLIVLEIYTPSDSRGNSSYEIPLDSVVIPDILCADKQRPTLVPIPIR